jgi:adenylyltransferase/sulfurtransferase
VLPGIIGTIQATEALKLALGCGESLLNRLLLFDALGMRFREIKVRPDPGCPVCGKNPSIKELIDYNLDCQTIMNTDEVTVKELKQALDNPASGIRVIDVRELAEYQVARIPGAQLLPLSELTQRWGELDPSKEYYLHCKAGVRSMKALLFLRQQGFKHLKSVKGGISAWSDEIDASVPKY